MDKNLIDLVKRCQNGDKSALISLIKSEENNIYSTLYYLNKDNIELYDIAQNVLLKLTTNIKSLKKPEYFKTWLNRITINAYYDYMRKLKRKSKYVKTSEIPTDIIDGAISPLNSMLDKEMNKIITKSILYLPKHYKIPITLREIQGLSYEDISSITNVSIGTVKSRIARARGIIKNEINKYKKD